MMHSAPPSALQLKAHILKVGSQSQLELEWNSAANSLWGYSYYCEYPEIRHNIHSSVFKFSVLMLSVLREKYKYCSEQCMMGRLACFDCLKSYASRDMNAW
jgi:hypothetical protein